MIEPNAQSRGPDRFYYGWVVVAASALVMMVSFGLHVSYGLFLAPLGEEFGWSRATISGAYSLSSIVAGTVGLLAGVLTDRLGARVVVSFCGVLFGAGCMLMSQVDSVWELYLFFGILLGAGMSGMWVPPLSTVARWFEKRCSLATGIVLSGMTVGQVVVPLIVSRLNVAWGWRNSFLVYGLVAMVIIVAGAQFLRRHPGSRPAPAAAGDCAAARHPVAGLTYGEAIRTRQFWMVGAVFFFVGTAAFGVLIHLAPRAISLGISEVDAANVLAVAGAVGIAGSFLVGGLLGARIGDRRAFIVALVLVMVAMLLLVPAGELWALYVCAVIFGLGMSGMGTSESPLVAELFGLRNHGSIYASIGLGYTAGAAVGPLIFGLVFDATGGLRPRALLRSRLCGDRPRPAGGLAAQARGGLDRP